MCVEFKNQKESDISNLNLHKKVKNSDDTFKQICLENIIHFQLEQYKGKYVDEIITNDSVFFKKEFQKSYGCNFIHNI